MKTSLFIGLILLIFIPTVYGQSIIPEQELLGQGSPTLVEKDGYRLRPEAAQAFDAMKIAALKDGIDIKVVSSYRDYAHQNRIWERKYLRFRESGLTPMQAIEKIIEYSTIPGTSRHHWATDLDLIDGTPKVDGDVLVPSKFHGTGPFCKFKDWMDIHANTFGFQLVYTDEINRKGFKYEPWHYSYASLSKSYLQAYNALDIQQMLAAAKLMGSENFTDEFIVRYLKENVNDVNQSLFD